MGSYYRGGTFKQIVLAQTGCAPRASYAQAIANRWKGTLETTRSGLTTRVEV